MVRFNYFRVSLEYASSTLFDKVRSRLRSDVTVPFCYLIWLLQIRRKTCMCFLGYLPMLPACASFLCCLSALPACACAASCLLVQLTFAICLCNLPAWAACSNCLCCLSVLPACAACMCSLQILSGYAACLHYLLVLPAFATCLCWLPVLPCLRFLPGPLFVLPAFALCAAFCLLVHFAFTFCLCCAPLQPACLCCVHVLPAWLSSTCLYYLSVLPAYAACLWWLPVPPCLCFFPLLAVRVTCLWTVCSFLPACAHYFYYLPVLRTSATCQSMLRVCPTCLPELYLPVLPFCVTFLCCLLVLLHVLQNLLSTYAACLRYQPVVPLLIFANIFSKFLTNRLTLPLVMYRISQFPLGFTPVWAKIHTSKFTF